MTLPRFPTFAWVPPTPRISPLRGMARPPQLKKRGGGGGSIPDRTTSKTKAKTFFGMWPKNPLNASKASPSNSPSQAKKAPRLPTPQELANDPLNAVRSVISELAERNLLPIVALAGLGFLVLAPVYGILIAVLLALTTVWLLPFAVVGLVLYILHVPGWLTLAEVLLALAPLVFIFSGISRTFSSVLGAFVPWLAPEVAQAAKEREEEEKRELEKERQRQKEEEKEKEKQRQPLVDEDAAAAEKDAEDAKNFAEESLSSFDQRLQKSDSNPSLVSGWTSSFVSQQLALEGLDAYAARFAAQNIDGLALLSLEAEDLLLPELAGPSPPPLGDQRKFAGFLKRVKDQARTD